MSKFEFFTDRAGEYRWRLKATNGRIVAASEGYKTLAGAVRGARAVQKAAAGAKFHLPG